MDVSKKVADHALVTIETIQSIDGHNPEKGYELIIEGTAQRMAIPIGPDGKDFVDKLNPGDHILIVYGGLKDLRAVYGPLKGEHFYTNE